MTEWYEVGRLLYELGTVSSWTEGKGVTHDDKGREIAFDEKDFRGFYLDIENRVVKFACGSFNMKKAPEVHDRIVFECTKDNNGRRVAKSWGFGDEYDRLNNQCEELLTPAEREEKDAAMEEWQDAERELRRWENRCDGIW